MRAPPTHPSRLLGIALAMANSACHRTSEQQAASAPTAAVPVDAIESLPLGPETAGDLAAFGAAVGDRRIVLLGENSHGVAEFSSAKVRLVEYLHERLGFDVLAFESGYHECREANGRLDSLPPISVMRDCLIYQLEHQETVPLFTYAVATRHTAHPLTIAGIDLQLQGRVTRTRPVLFRGALSARAPGIADRVAVLDSTLVELRLGPRDSLSEWIRRHGVELRALYDSGAAVTTGETNWTFQTAAAFMRRERYRVSALAVGLAPPTEVYEIRDAWMANTIARYAEADSGRHRVVVWLHNDHARYGSWRAGSLRIRSVGQFLRDRFAGEVYSVGFFAMVGEYADNSRRVRRWAEPPPGSLERVIGRANRPVAFLRLTESSIPEVRAWAQQEHPYVRAGQVYRMVPGREFDALLLFATVSPAEFLPR